MNILINPASNFQFDLRIANSLKVSFERLGHKVFLNNSNFSDKFIFKNFNENQLDIIFRINNFPQYDKKIKNIVWVQDVNIHTEEDINNSSLKNHDDIYFVHYPEILGIKSKTLLKKSKILKFGCDISIIDKFKNREISNPNLNSSSLVGSIFFPTPDYYIKKNNKFFIILKILDFYLIRIIFSKIKFLYYKYVKNTFFEKFVEKIGLLSIYRNLKYIFFRTTYSNPSPDRKYFSDAVAFVSKNYDCLSGSLNTRKLIESLDSKFIKLNHHLKNYLVKDIPRQMDRIKIANILISANFNLTICGNNYENWEEFKRYSKGFISDHNNLIDIFRSNYYNFFSNSHSMYYHPTVLECIASKSFILMHGLNSKNSLNLTNDIPMGKYDPNNFLNSIEIYNDSSKRQKIIEDGYASVCNHTYDHRVKEILKNL